MSEFRMFLGMTARPFHLVVAVAILLLTLPSLALGSPTDPKGQQSDVQEFLKLLGKADVQEWLRSQQAQVTPSREARTAISEASFGRALSERLTAIRAHLIGLLRVIPDLGSEIRRAAQRLRDDSGGSGLLSILMMFLISAGLGFAAQAVARSRVTPGRPRADSEDQSLVAKRRRRLGTSLARELAGVLAFCFACFAPFLLLGRDRLSDSILLSFLAACAVWVTSRAVASVIAASVEDGQSMECRAEKAHFCFWMVVATGWFALGSATAEATRLTGMEPLATELVSYALGVGLLAIGLAAIWRAPQLSDSPVEHPTRRHFAYRWLVTLFLIVLWVVWVAGAMRLFWLLAIGVLTPIALGAVRRLTKYLFLADKEEQEGEIVSTSIIVVDAMLRATVVGIALWILADAWEIGFSQMTAGDDPVSKVARALLKALVILFAFDVLWQFTRTVIDLKIARVDETAASGSLTGIRQAKLRTLLPVARNFVMVFFATLAVLMTLSTLGIEIGPLVASAGVVGLAIGFGAQTLVKDVISGIFYLLDDAFRVGEYIISGNYKGTVQSFSLRSVRLRHQNGPVYTIPFNLLGAVQNVSRDYAVSKFMMTVTYDADLEKVRKLIKRVGEELTEDPDLAAALIEPLKLQGVNDFGTYGVQVKLKATTKPGFQSILRKKAFPLIKKAFDENGIEFARPVVRVAEGQGATQVAAGQQMVAMSTPPSA